MLKHAILFAALLLISVRGQEEIADDIAQDLLEDAVHRVIDDVACHAQGGHYMGRDYYFETSKKRDRDESEQFCNTLGMNLVSVNNCRENEFIVRFIRAMRCEYEDFWTGAYQNGDRFWYWPSTGAAMSYSNWKVGEPNYAKDEFCVHYRKDYMQWNDKKCSDKYYAVCSTK